MGDGVAVAERNGKQMVACGVPGHIDVLPLSVQLVGYGE